VVASEGNDILRCRATEGVLLRRSASTQWPLRCPLIWCTRGCTLQTPQLRVSQDQLRYNSSDCLVYHRTIRCASGATTICAQRSTLTDEQCSTVTRQKSEQKVRTIRCGTGRSCVAPDCPVPHEDKASNGRPAPNPNDRVTWRRTGHCPVRPSLTTFSNGYNLVGGYKYHPNRPLQGEGDQATFQVI
jgi:hypothetical protein